MRRTLLIFLLVFAVSSTIVVYRQLPQPVFQFTAGWFAAPPPQDAALVLFTGDVFLGRAVERWLLQRPNASVFTNASSTLNHYEEVVINFEAAIPEVHEPTPDFGFQFSVDEELLSRLSPNVTAASLANNHAFDFGMAGYTHAQEVLSRRGIAPFGHPQQIETSYYVTATEPSVAVIGVNQLGTRVSAAELQAVVTEAQAVADLVVAYVHWGNEYTTTISSQQQTLAEVLAAAKVDLVIGHHPHVVQPITVIDRTLVLYSLGNTVFDQYFSEAVQRGLLVGLERRAGRLGLSLYPISSLATPHQPAVLTGSERVRQLENLAVLSDDAVAESVRNGFVPLPER